MIIININNVNYQTNKPVNHAVNFNKIESIDNKQLTIADIFDMFKSVGVLSVAVKPNEKYAMFISPDAPRDIAGVHVSIEPGALLRLKNDPVFLKEQLRITKHNVHYSEHPRYEAQFWQFICSVRDTPIHSRTPVTDFTNFPHDTAPPNSMWFYKGDGRWVMVEHTSIENYYDNYKSNMAQRKKDREVGMQLLEAFSQRVATQRALGLKLANDMRFLNVFNEVRDQYEKNAIYN